MISIMRTIVLTAGLLTFPMAIAAAQQDNSDPNGGAALKSTTPGNPNDARSSAMASTPSGGSTLKSVTPGDTGKKVVPGSSSQSANAASGGSSGSQHQ